MKKAQEPKGKKGEWTFADTCNTCSMPVFYRTTTKLPEVLRYCSHGIQASPVYGPHGSQVWTYPNVIYANSTANATGREQYTLTTGGGNGGEA